MLSAVDPEEVPVMFRDYDKSSFEKRKQDTFSTLFLTTVPQRRRIGACTAIRSVQRCRSDGLSVSFGCQEFAFVSGSVGIRGSSESL
jgi:hypothetical protein